MKPQRRRSPFLKLYEGKTALHETVDTLLGWLEGSRTLENNIEWLARVAGDELARETRKNEKEFVTFYEKFSRALIPSIDTYEFVTRARCPVVMFPHARGPRIQGTHEVSSIPAEFLSRTMESDDRLLADSYPTPCVRCETLEERTRTHPTEISFRRMMPKYVAERVHRYEHIKERLLYAQTLLMRLDSEQDVFRKREDIEMEIALLDERKQRARGEILYAHDGRVAQMEYVHGNPMIIESDMRIKSAGSLWLKFVDYLLVFDLARSGELGEFAGKARPNAGEEIGQIDDVYAGKLIVPFHVDTTFPLVRDIIDVAGALGARVLPTDDPIYELFEPKDKPWYKGVSIFIEWNGLLMEYQVQTPRERELDRETHKRWKEERDRFISYARERGRPVDELLAFSRPIFNYSS